MIQLEYLPRKNSRKWLKSFRMHPQGRENMQADALKLAVQNDWFSWRIVDA